MLSRRKSRGEKSHSRVFLSGRERKQRDGRQRSGQKLGADKRPTLGVGVAVKITAKLKARCGRLSLISFAMRDISNEMKVSRTRVIFDGKVAMKTQKPRRAIALIARHCTAISLCNFQQCFGLEGNHKCVFEKFTTSGGSVVGMGRRG